MAEEKEITYVRTPEAAEPQGHYSQAVVHEGIVVNAVYADFFGNHRPARGVVLTKELHLGLDVAFEVTAAC